MLDALGRKVTIGDLVLLKNVSDFRNSESFINHFGVCIGDEEFFTKDSRKILVKDPGSLLLIATQNPNNEETIQYDNLLKEFSKNYNDYIVMEQKMVEQIEKFAKPRPQIGIAQLKQSKLIILKLGKLNQAGIKIETREKINIDVNFLLIVSVSMKYHEEDEGIFTRKLLDIMGDEDKGVISPSQQSSTIEVSLDEIFNLCPKIRHFQTLPHLSYLYYPYTRDVFELISYEKGNNHLQINEVVDKELKLSFSGEYTYENSILLNGDRCKLTFRSIN